MPAKRVERYDWSTSLCFAVTLPDAAAARMTPSEYRDRQSAIRDWLHDPNGPASGVYQRSVLYPTTGSGEPGIARVVYRFSSAETGRLFCTDFVKRNYG